MTFLCLEFLSWLRVVSQDAAADDDDDDWAPTLVYYI